jgi:RHS repeat-associated protein
MQTGFNYDCTPIYVQPYSLIACRNTGKERDAESGNDYFGARYYASSMGRFMSPDPLLNSGRPENPQTWNRYAYSRNNPLTNIDPTGLYDFSASGCADGDSKCQKNFQQNEARFRTALDKLTQARDSFKSGSAEYNRINASITAYGTEGDHNGVNVGFGSLPGNAAGNTAPLGDGHSFNVTFDMSKIGGNTTSLAIDAGHEGTHVSDFERPADQLGGMSLFQIEYRGYQTSSYVGQGLGVNSLSFPGGVLWNKSWAAVDIQTLRDKGATQQVLHAFPDADHKETQPHDPFPNQ